MSNFDIPFFPADIMRLTGITHTGTLRKKIIAGVIPKPDVQLTQKTRYWHRATLVKAGLLPPEAIAPTAPALPA
jgi:hypothetical protein